MTSGAADGGAVEAVGEHTGSFKRAFGLVDAVAVVVGSMIGSGIFIVSAETARNVGSPGMLLVCWVVAGLLTIIAALCYSEMAAMFPKAGGQYVFLREAYGPLWGFLYGWTLFLVIQSGTIAAVGVAFSKFFGVFVPAVSNTNILFSVGNWKFSAGQIVSVVLIAFLTWMNCRGVETGKKIQTSFTVAKVCAVAGLIVLGFLAFDKFNGLQVNLAQFWNSVNDKGEALSGTGLILAMGLAMVGPLFACDAWNNITFAGEEVKDAEKILPRSLAVGTGLVVFLYLLANVAYLLLLPLHGTADGATIVARGITHATEDRVGTAAAEIIFGGPGKWIMAGAIMISTFGCLNGLILAGARVYYAMAKDGLFFKKAAILNPVSNVPVFGLIIQGVWSAILATSGSYNQLLEYVMFTTLLFYLFSVAAVLTLRKKMPDVQRPYKVPLYPILPVLYLVATVAIMVGQLWLSPGTTGAGLALVVLGVPVYFYLNRKRPAI
ncbi:MAG TPA: amino acid permease [Candidatus Obscuribacterales bacterium]